MRQFLEAYKKRRTLLQVEEEPSGPRGGAVLGAGCRVPLAQLSDRELRAAQGALTFYPTTSSFALGGGGSSGATAPSVPIVAFKTEEDALVVPRCYGARVFGASPSGLTEGRAAPALKFEGVLREKQVQAAQACEDALRCYPHATMLVLPCGFGKTVVALSVAAKLQRKTLIIVHKEFLMEQWRERINAFLPGVKVGQIQGAKVVVDECDVVIGMIASLASPNRQLPCLDDFGTVVLDEAHHMAARMFSTVFFRLRAKFVLGLTATPIRKDSCTALLHEHMGTFAFKAEPDPGTALVLRITYLSPWSRRQGQEIPPAEAQRLKTKMTRDSQRNRLLLDWCLKTAAAGRKTLLLSDRVQHLRDLHAEFEALRVDNEGVEDDQHQHRHVSSALYIGGMKQAEREKASEADTIFGTFALAQEGLDIPALDTLVLGTPASDITQAVGRILREFEGKMRPVVVDVLDDHCRNFKRLNDVRAGAYTRRAFRVVDVECSDFSRLAED